MKQAHPNVINLKSVLVPNNPFHAVSSTLLTRINRLASEKSGLPGVIKKLLKKWIEHHAAKLLENNKSNTIEVQIRGHGTFHANECNGQVCVAYLNHYQPLYEPDIEVIIEVCVRNMEAFIDCGANWGYFTGKALLSNPRLKCWAIEPSPIPFHDLRRMTQALGNQYDIELVESAVSYGRETFALSESAFDSGTNYLTTLSVSDTSSIKVNSFPLDDLSVPAKSLIKIDVEGHELDVLKGMSSLLELAQCVIIFEHWHLKPNALNPILGFLSEFGFEIYQTITTPKSSAEFESTILDAQLISPVLTIGGRYNLVAIHRSSKLLYPVSESPHENH